MPIMSYDSIKKQLSKLKAQAAKMEAAESVAKKRSVAKVTALMKKLGVSTADLEASGAKGTSKRTPRATKKTTSSGSAKPVAIKYRHPSTNETWTGRGKPPKWLAAEIAAGKTREDFLVQS